jgi:hypothetical protein
MRKSLDRICQHCYELIVGNAYRVTSEEAGIPCLILLFAPSVLWRQKGLGSIRRKSMSGANILQLEAGGVTSLDSAFNCCAWLSSVIRSSLRASLVLGSRRFGDQLGEEKRGAEEERRG